MKIFLIGWDNSDEAYVRTAEKLKNSGIEIVYWVGGDREEGYENCRKIFPGTIFHRRQDAMRGRRPKETGGKKFLPPGEDMISRFYETESTLLAMKNFEKTPLPGLGKKRLFHEFLEYWHGVLDEFKPDAVVFGVWPHTGYNYVAYQMAKHLKIKTVMFEYARIGDRLLLINDFTEGSRELKAKLAEAQNREIKLEDLSADVREYYLNETKDGKYELPPDMQILSGRFRGLRLALLKIQAVLRSIVDFTILKKILEALKKRNSNLKKEYESLQKEPDFEKKYIYAAIHYQPECSTSPLGGVFVDQILMIKILAAAIPENWEIYVKEHPYQWLPSGLAYSAYRYKGYYEEMAKIDKVRLVPAKTNSKELIKKSQAVATVTGTAGWEALINLIPAITFGHAWYRDCPGNFRVKNVQTAREALGKINAGRGLSKGEIIRYLFALDRSTFHAYLEDVVKLQSKLTLNENAENISSSLLKELKT